MEKPVIAVSLNYRLQCWGFMWSKEMKEAGVGNLGLRDQRLALHWIQESRYLDSEALPSTDLTMT